MLNVVSVQTTFKKLGSNFQIVTESLDPTFTRNEASVGCESATGRVVRPLQIALGREAANAKQFVLLLS